MKTTGASEGEARPCSQRRCGEQWKRITSLDVCVCCERNGGSTYAQV